MNSGYKQMYQAKNQRQIEINSNYDNRAYQSISPKSTNTNNYNSKSPTNMNRKAIQMQHQNMHSQKPLIQNNDFEYSQTYHIVNEMSFSSKSPQSRNKTNIQIPFSSTPSSKKITSQKSSQSQNKVPFQKYQQGSNLNLNQQIAPPQQSYVQQREFLNSSPINLDRFENLNVGKQSMIQKNSFQKPNWVNLKQNNNIANTQQSSSPINMHRSEMDEKRDQYAHDRFKNNNSQQFYQSNSYANYPKIQFSSINSVDEHQQSNFRSPEFNYAQPEYDTHNVVRQIQFFDDASKENYDSFKPSNSRSPQNKFNNHNYSAHQQQHQNSVNNQKHYKSDYGNNTQYQSKCNGLGNKIQQNMLFKNSDKLLKEVCQENEYFSDEQTTYQVNTILSTIQKEKQIIMNDMNYLLCQVKKYKGLCKQQNLDSKQEDSESKTEDQNSNLSEQLTKPSKQQKELSQDQQQDQIQLENKSQSSKKDLSFLQDSSICLDKKQKAVNQLLSKWVSEDADGCLTFEADSQQDILQSNSKEIQDLENFTQINESDQKLINQQRTQKNERQTEKEVNNRKQNQEQKLINQEYKQQEQEYMPESETYLKMAHLLSEMNVDPSLILPNPSNLPQNNEAVKDIDDRSIIEIQKLIIKKLINKVEEGKEMNSILLQKLKYQSNQSIVSIQGNKKDMSQFTTLRSEVKSWNLGSDDKLIKGIQQFSDKLFQNAQTSLDNFQELKYLLNSCNIEINNTFSQYQKLSERKFTEQKMAPISDAIPTQEEKKDTQDRISTEAKRIDFFKNALSKGLEAFNIGGNDEQNDDFQDERSVSQNSITYSVTSVTSGIMKNQRLPFFIGSKIFMDDRHIGLILRDDDDDEDAPQDGQNIISQDVYDPSSSRTQSQINGNSIHQGDPNANGIPPAPPMDNMNGIPPAPPINMNGVPPAPAIGNLIPPAPPINGIPPPPPVNLNQSGIPNAPPILVNSNAPPAPPINLFIPPPPSINMQGSSAAPLIPQQNSMGLENSGAVDEGNLQQQLLMALQKQTNRQNRAPSTAQPRPLTLQEEIQKIGRQKNQDHALVEQEEDPSLIRPPPAPQNNAPFRMSVRDALTQSIIGDPMAASSQDQNSNSQTKQVNKQLPVPSALFSQAGFINNLMNDEDDEGEEKQKPTRHRSTRFTFNNLFNIEKPQFDEDDQIELDKNKNNKSNVSSMVQQPSEGKKVQFMEPNQQSNLLPPPPPIAPPIPILKQEPPKKKLEKLFESSDEDSKDPFAKAQKIGQQYRQEEKQAKIQAITRQSTSNNTKKKIFDDSDSDVENFKSKQTPVPPVQNNPPQRQTTTKAKIFNSDSEDDDKKPKQQAPVPAVSNPLAASSNSKPQTDLKPAIKNPLGGIGSRVSSKKRGLYDDSSQNSNSEDESSSAQAQNSQAAALKQQQEAEKQKQEAERIQKEQEQARLQQEAQKRQQEKEEEERKRKLEQEEQMRQLKLKQQEEERILRQKMEEEQRKKQQEEEEEKKKQAAAAAASQLSQPVAAGFGRTANKTKKKNKLASSSENEDSDEEDNNTSQKNPAPPVIQTTSSIITYNQQSVDPAPALNPMEDALKNSEKQSSTSENPISRNQSLTNRVSQALKDKIESMGSFDPTKMLKGMTFIPKKPEQVQEEIHKSEDQQQQDSQPIDKSLLISTQMDRVSIPMKKKKARTIQKFVDTSDQQQLTVSNNFASNKASIILPDDEDEKPLAVQKRNIPIKEKVSIQPPTSNLPNISNMPKKGLDLGNSDDDSGPLMQKKTQPLSRPSNPVTQSQSKPKGVLDLGASDDDDKPLMNKKPQAPAVQKQNPLPPLPADDTIKPIQHNPPATLTSSQKNDDSAAQNKLLKGLPNILGAPKSSENKKSTKLKLGDSDDDDKPLAIQKRQVQSLMPQNNTQSNQKQNNDNDDLGIKPIARNSESLQGASGLPNILSNPLSSNSNQAPSRASGLPNISSNPLGKSNMATNKDKKDKKKKVMFSDDEDEEQDSKLAMPKLNQRPSAGLSNDATESVPKPTSLPQRPSKKNLFGDDSDDDQIGNNNAATNAPKPPERPSANLSGKPKGRNLFDDSDDDNKKPEVSATTSNPLSQSSNLNTAPVKPQLPSLSNPKPSNRNLFNEDSDDEPLKNASKNPLGQAKGLQNPLAQSRPSQNPLGGGKQAPPSKPKKSLFDDSD
ncbi:hypothetical protein TTHERM_00427390 (macronuclear) [Tetrahymena thermophila SB210]|uniref:Uncharacterized protein n=2 Tax=Tetrahymena thermophila (strain SB210) TaxID=312017 RepID=Q23AB9_TETTS|nr:hypothetical protein TTHERM_00427390 [Tetrahymena thermophila SB210]EAR93573.2 hypothetical protein TTHERM_00427390 [Tetrahymena thermophila SB210]|eukprot:XP_001013818.2 hypothetical protein TTHERM_00427390 [Tetrahymena thermophila SB210]